MNASRRPILVKVPLLVVGILGGALVGAGAVGAAVSGSSDPATPAASGSTTVEDIAAVAENSACVEALDAAERIMDHSSDVIGVTSEILSGPAVDAVNAALIHDIDGLEAATEDVTAAREEMDAINDEMALVDYWTPAAECRG